MWTPLLALALAFQTAPVPTEAAEPLTIVPRAWLAIERVDASGRRPFRPDAVFAKHLLDRAAPPPEAGQALVGETGEEQTWTAREADENGTLDGRPGYAYAAVASDAERVLLANLQRASTLFVNGAAFQGDMYGYGFGGVPVLLRKGVNHVFVTGIRGGFALRFVEPETELVIAAWDVTRTDLLVGESGRDPGLSLPLLNATTEPRTAGVRFSRLTLDPAEELPVSQGGGHVDLAPLGMAAAVVETAFVPGSVAEAPGRARLRLRVAPVPAGEDASPAAGAEQELEIEVRQVDQAHVRLHPSGIDGSWQYHAELPPPDYEGGRVPRVVLSLHGAGVHALNQARSYSARPDLLLVAPTNRRPFGFDWQDWGRADAYEVLAEVDARHAPSFTFLTGHSMGGHGVWHLAANDPDRFDAIAPSAGWRSFDSYGGRPEGELRELWHAADGASQTEALIANLVPLPTFILHGEADDNVPAAEAHAMEALLREHGATPDAHYQEGAGHWWDSAAAPGADCVDWPGIFELFARTEAAEPPLELDWTSVDPAVDARHHFITVEQPLVYGTPFRVRTRFDEERGTLALETVNVRRLILQRPADAVERYVLDGQELALRSTVLERNGGSWSEVPIARPPGTKSPLSSGPFKRAFDNRFVFVHGTAGDDARDAELLERARFDQQQWWYRANAAPPVVADKDFEKLPAGDRAGRRSGPRNAILYGNAETNAAWDRLVPGSCPIRVREGAIELGERTFEGTDLACVFVYPRAGDTTGKALVGAFGSTGAAGARLGYVLAPFVSGVGYPDYVIFDAGILTRGDGGVLAAGWFDHAWQLQPGGYTRE